MTYLAPEDQVARSAAQQRPAPASADPSEVEVFLASLRMIETGQWDGRYNVRRTDNGNLGAYQIAPADWVAWTAELGMSGADWRDPRAQDYVARAKVKQLFAEYGSWELVATAWSASPAVADYAVEHGLQQIGGLSMGGGFTLGDFTNTLRRLMDSAPDYYVEQGAKRSRIAHEFTNEGFVPSDPVERRRTRVTGPDLNGQLTEFLGALEAGAPQQPVSPLREKLVGSLNAISNGIAGGQRSALPPLVEEAQVPELKDRLTSEGTIANVPEATDA